MISTEESWRSWLCDLEAEDYGFINQSDINGVDESLTHHDLAPKPQENPNSRGSFSTDSTMSNNSSGDDNSSFQRPSKMLKITSTSNSANTGYAPTKKDSPPSSYILSFNSANPAPMLSIDSALTPKGNNNKVVNSHGRPFPAKGSMESQKKEPRRNNQKTGSAGRSPQHAHDHIIAERMRREKISQQFIALSALIPGLKKMDKATVLGDSIKYVKELQERVKLLEERAKRKSVESVVYVEKSHQLSSEEDVSDTSSNSGDGNSGDVSKTSRSLPEVEARVSEKNVLIRIHCEKQKGVLMYILREIEKFHLSVLNSSSLPFGTSIVDITITAEMDDEFSLSVKELARNLKVGLLQFM